MNDFPCIYSLLKGKIMGPFFKKLLHNTNINEVPFHTSYILLCLISITNNIGCMHVTQGLKW